MKNTVVSITLLAAVLIATSGECLGGDTDANIDIAALMEHACERPSLIVPRAKLGEIRRRVRDDVHAHKWWKGFEAHVCGDFVEHGVAVPRGLAQWFHYYSCRKCGSQLKTHSPTNHVCPECGETHTGWPYDQACNYFAHTRAADAARECAIAYLISEDRRFAAVAARILAEYATFYPELPLHDNSSDGPKDITGLARASCGRLYSQALDESVWLIKIVQTFDAIADTLTPDEKKAVVERILRPAAALIRRDCMKIHNHECWHLSAYGLVALALGDEQTVREALTGEYGAFRQLACGCYEDGCWHEGSWGYHFYTMRGLGPIFTAMHNLGCRPPEAYRRMFLAPFGQLTPAYQLPAVHDSPRIGFPRGAMASMYEQAWSWWKDPSCAWWIAGSPRDNEGYVLYGSPLPKPDEMTVPVFRSRDFGGTGFAVLRSRSADCREAIPDNFVAVDYGKHAGGHGHPDKLNLIICARGRLLAEDFGCISYGNPLHWHWYRSTLAHNTVTMDGVNQRQSEGRCLSFEDDGRCAKIVCEAGPEAFPGAKATRSLSLEGDRLVDVFTVESADEHDWEWALHARGSLSTSVTMASVQPPPRDEEKIKGFSSRANGSDAWGWTECLREGETKGGWSACWRKDGRSVLDSRQTIVVDGRAAPVCRVRTAVVCAQPPPEKAELIACRVRGRKAIFRTEYDLSGRGFAVK